MIRFTVYGTPVPQGSTKGFVYFDKITKRPRAAVTHDSNAKLKSFRQDVSKEALAAAQGRGCPLSAQIPVAVIVVCYFAKPKSAKKHARKTTKPDADKLLRTVLDGMAGIVYEHDAQVTDARVVKRFGTPERAEIAVGLAE